MMLWVLDWKMQLILHIGIVQSTLVQRLSPDYFDAHTIFYGSLQPIRIWCEVVTTIPFCSCSMAYAVGVYNPDLETNGW